ncbi:MAG: MiaB/RimO family radical SAM methylthiotransferase [Ruthenibacterium sp.]
MLADVLRSMQTGERIVDIVPHEGAEIFEELPMEQMTGRNRAFMKIEDGCNRQCAYCVIPRARGSVRSRSEESILAELHALAADGNTEVVFSGINLSSYGKDTGTCLADIVEKAARVEGIWRIRLGSLEPDLMDDAQLSRLAAVDSLCPQFHLALQSGCDATLRRMRRIYTVQEYRTVVQKIRALLPHATFITDMIVGFPGETEDEFAQSLRFAQEIGFLKVHVFSFSRREGTPAYNMPEQIDASVKAQRSHALQTEADAMRARIIASLRGTQAEVLLEKRVNAFMYTGYTREYVPVLVFAPQHTQGDIVSVTLGDFDGERCAAVLLRP